MHSPWLKVPLRDYEGHMTSPEVGQLPVLSELFKCALDFCRPESVAVLGIAGGNGLEQIDPAVTTRIVGVDINEHYLEEVRHRFASLAGLELHWRDITERNLGVEPVDLVHAALLFEHAGVSAALENALALVAPGGRLSTVLQLPSAETHGVSPSGYTSMQALAKDFAFVDPVELQDAMRMAGFELVEAEGRQLPAGKAFWLGIFARST